MKTLIFDMDGLMFDTESLWIKFSQESAKTFNIILPEKLIYGVIGTTQIMTKNAFLEEYGNNFDFDDFLKTYRQLSFEYIEKEGTPIKRGLLELISYLKKEKYKIAIASSSKREILEFYLKNANIDKNIFDIIVSGDMVKNSKPEPDIFLKACELLNEKPNNCYVLEDSNNGIIAAHLSRCVPILIPDKDVIKKENLQKAKYKFNDLLEVKEFLENQKVA